MALSSHRWRLMARSVRGLIRTGISFLSSSAGAATRPLARSNTCGCPSGGQRGPDVPTTAGRRPGFSRCMSPKGTNVKGTNVDSRPVHSGRKHDVERTGPWACPPAARCRPRPFTLTPYGDRPVPICVGAEGVRQQRFPKVKAARPGAASSAPTFPASHFSGKSDQKK